MRLKLGWIVIGLIALVIGGALLTRSITPQPLSVMMVAVSYTHLTLPTTERV